MLINFFDALLQDDSINITLYFIDMDNVGYLNSIKLFRSYINILNFKFCYINLSLETFVSWYNNLLPISSEDYAVICTSRCFPKSNNWLDLLYSKVAFSGIAGFYTHEDESLSFYDGIFMLDIAWCKEQNLFLDKENVFYNKYQIFDNIMLGKYDHLDGFKRNYFYTYGTSMVNQSFIECKNPFISSTCGIFKEFFTIGDYTNYGR